MRLGEFYNIEWLSTGFGPLFEGFCPENWFPTGFLVHIFGRKNYIAIKNGSDRRVLTRSTILRVDGLNRTLG